MTNFIQKSNAEVRHKHAKYVNYKREHAIKRCQERCERKYKDYKRDILSGAAELMFKESNTRRWFRFRDPSGKYVYGLWNTSSEIFWTFLTEEMFANRLAHEAELNDCSEVG